MSEPLLKENRPPRLLIGAMSGTSADGVDAALTQITGRGLDMQAAYLGHVEQPYDPDLRKRIFALRESGSVELKDLARLGRDITLAYARAVKALLAQQSVQPSQIAAIAAHGQTLYHGVPDTIQWLDPSLLAAQTGIAVVSDFRRADLAAGGQGAPLVPFADWILFRHPEKTRVILNIGGIANLTYLPAGGGIDDVIAFDTGPGMCVSDWLMRERDPTRRFDEDGRLASLGEPNGPILKHLSSLMLPRAEEWRAYTDKAPPKSLDTPLLLSVWRETCFEYERLGALKLEDLLATAGEWVAGTVVGQLREHVPQVFAGGEVIAMGGGTKNRDLIDRLRRQLSWSAGRIPMQQTFMPQPLLSWNLVEAESVAVPTQAREAVAFAILGAATLDNEPSNVPSATGATRRVVLGSMTPSPLPGQ